MKIVKIIGVATFFFLLASCGTNKNVTASEEPAKQEYREEDQILDNEEALKEAEKKRIIQSVSKPIGVQRVDAKKIPQEK